MYGGSGSHYDSKTDELSTLWEELDLKGLLVSSAKNIPATNRQEKLNNVRSKIVSPGPKRLDKIYKESSFETLMNRYKTTPRPITYITESTIEKLADPIKGRHRDVQQDNDVRNSYVQSPISKGNPRPSLRKPSAPSFFLTAEEEIDDSSNSEKRKVCCGRPLVKKVQNFPKVNNVKTRNTKANRSMFVDKYLSARNGQQPISIIEAKPNGWKSSLEMSKKMANVKSKYLKPAAKPEWSLRPPQGKGGPDLPKPAVPRPTAKKTVPIPLSRKFEKRVPVDQPLRSKSSADVRSRLFPSNGSSVKMVTSRKPSPTSKLFDLDNPRRHAPKPQVVLSPIKPLKPRELDVNEKIDISYKRLQKHLGLGGGDRVSKAKSPSSRPDIDTEVLTILKRAEAAATGKIASQENNAAFLLGNHARKLSNHFSELNDWKSKYQALSDDFS